MGTSLIGETSRVFTSGSAFRRKIEVEVQIRKTLHWFQKQFAYSKNMTKTTDLSMQKIAPEK